MKATTMELSPKERDLYGVIVSVRHQQTGQMRSLHEPGRAREALARACERVTAMGDEWRIVSISTPPSIYRDLQGIRVRERRRGFLKTEEIKSRSRVDDPRPEIQQLGQIGLLHLLEDRRAL